MKTWNIVSISIRFLDQDAQGGSTEMSTNIKKHRVDTEEAVRLYENTCKWEEKHAPFYLHFDGHSLLYTNKLFNTYPI